MNAARRWLKRHRAIGDAIKGWDEAGGEIPVNVDAIKWRVVPAGEAPESADGYDPIVCGDPVPPERLRRLFGNPPATDDD